MLALSCVLVLISQEDLPRAQGSDVKKMLSVPLSPLALVRELQVISHAAAPRPKEPSHGPLIFP